MMELHLSVITTKCDSCQEEVKAVINFDDYDVVEYNNAVFSICEDCLIAALAVIQGKMTQ